MVFMPLPPPAAPMRSIAVRRWLLTWGPSLLLVVGWVVLARWLGVVG